MTEAIFLLEKPNKTKITQAVELGADAIFVGHKNMSRDLLRWLKDKGIKLYAEVGIFVGGESWEKYPDSRPIDREGQPMEKIDWYAGVCPSHPGVRREKLGEIRELIGEYEIDGIWLDFIRYPCHWEEVRSADITEYCFCQNCLRKFEKGVKTPLGWPNGLPKGGRKGGKAWIQWKCDRITNLVADVRTLINQSGKDLQLGMFSVPWREKDFGGAIKKVIGQDFKSLANHIDVFSPMVYHKMCGREPRWIHKIVAYMDKITGKPILPIIQTEDKPEEIPVKEFKEEVNQAIKKPSEGVIIFFLEDLLKDENKKRIVRQIFKRDLFK